MLRVRPVLHTAHPDAYAALLTSLGLTLVASDGGEQLFGGAHGVVELLQVPAGHPTDGAWALGFEIRDAAIFVRRTLADGTPAEEVPGGARFSTPHGHSVLAHAVPVDAPRTPADPAQALTVVAHWHTDTPEAAAQLLRNIGARPLPAPTGTERFAAKNGGEVRVERAVRDAVVLGFAYAGALPTLRSQLSQPHHATLVTADVLRVDTPDGGAWDIRRA